jgi:hypothetical protein
MSYLLTGEVLITIASITWSNCSIAHSPATVKAIFNQQKAVQA